MQPAITLSGNVLGVQHGFLEQEEGAPAWPRRLRLRDGEVVIVELIEQNKPKENNEMFNGGPYLTYAQTQGAPRGQMKGSVCLVCLKRCTVSKDGKTGTKNTNDHLKIGGTKCATATFKQKVKDLAWRKLSLWEDGTSTHKDNFEKVSLLPKSPGKKNPAFNSLSWWLRPGRRNLYRGLQIVAISYLIILATAVRPACTSSWCGTVGTARRNRLSPRKSVGLCF